MRLFISINFSQEIKDILIEAINDIKSKAIDGNFTRSENLHLTLAFIGETNNINIIKKVMDECSSIPKFSMALGGNGNFGNLYWVGIDKNNFLTNLANNLQSALRDKGFNIERRKFKPHITIARQVEVSSPICLNVPKSTMEVTHISLMKSERIFNKLTYTEIYGKDLE